MYVEDPSAHPENAMQTAFIRAIEKSVTTSFGNKAPHRRHSNNQKHIVFVLCDSDNI